MTDLKEKLREDDVYRWHYREPSDNDGAWGRYHCCSCIGIIRGGRLWDTFWQIRGNFAHDGRSFCEAELTKLELTLLGNLSDYEKANELNADYYDDTDVMNLNHSNSGRGNFYLRKGAKRSATKMLEVARQKMDQAKSDERMAAERAQRFHAAVISIEAGGNMDAIYL